MSASNQTTADGQQADVVVVGGGPAGVATALLLARRGLRAVVLEKQTGQHGRIGRFATYDMGGVAANLGTQVYGLNWHPLMREAMESYGLHRLKERGLGMKVGTWWNGAVAAVDHKDPAAPPTMSEVDWMAFTYKLGRDGLRHFERVDDFVVRIRKDHKHPDELAALDNTPVSEYLREVSPDLAREINAFTRMAGEGHVTQVSAVSFAAIYAGMTFFPAELNGVYIAEGGNHMLHLEMIKLLERAGGEYHYGVEASKLRQSADGVVVECTYGRHFSARYAVSATTPQVMLRTIEGLPPAVAQALSEVTASKVAMVGVRTRGEPFGEPVDIMLFPEEDVLDEKLRFPCFFRQDANAQGVVFTGVASDMLRKDGTVDPVAAQSDDQLVAAAIEQIRLARPSFQSSDLLEVRIERFDWCVVHPRLGFFTGIVPRIGIGHGRIYFAGDFLSPPAIAGAYGSAEAVVEAIVAADAKAGRNVA